MFAYARTQPAVGYKKAPAKMPGIALGANVCKELGSIFWMRRSTTALSVETALAQRISRHLVRDLATYARVLATFTISEMSCCHGSRHAFPRLLQVIP